MRGLHVKKLLVVAAVAGGALFVIKRNRDAKAEAELWREATAPPVQPAGASVNGSAPARSGASDSRNN